MDISMPEVTQWKRLEVFCCYARQDHLLLAELKKHLVPLQREGLINLWADVDISAGQEWEREIHRHLNAAQIILLLVSPDFMASEYCYSTEMKRAIERHNDGEAHVLPLIIRPVAWQKTPLSKLQALPTNAKPITKWDNQDEAFSDAAEGIRDVIERILATDAEQACLAKEERIRNVMQVTPPTPSPFECIDEYIDTESMDTYTLEFENPIPGSPPDTSVWNDDDDARLFAPHQNGSSTPNAPRTPNGRRSPTPLLLGQQPRISVPQIEERGEIFVMDKCPYCNAEIRPGDNFCLNCGNRLPSQIEEKGRVEHVADEQPVPIYLSPEEGFNSVIERLGKVQARRITLIIPPQTQLRSHTSWRLVHARMRELGKDVVLVISPDRHVRSVVHAAGFDVAKSQ